MKSLITTILVLTMLVQPIHALSEDGITHIEGESTFSLEFNDLSEDSYNIIMFTQGDLFWYYGVKDVHSTYPISNGSGMYEITIYEHVEDKTYVVKYSENVEFIVDQDVFLSSNTVVAWIDETSISERFKGWSVLSVYTYLKYSMEYDEDFHDDKDISYIVDIAETYDSMSGTCYEFSVIFAAIMRSNGIPCKVVHGELGLLKQYHAWNEVYMDGEWKIVDLTLAVTSRSGTYISDIYEDETNYSRIYEY